MFVSLACARTQNVMQICKHYFGSASVWYSSREETVNFAIQVTSIAQFKSSVICVISSMLFSGTNYCRYKSGFYYNFVSFSFLSFHSFRCSCSVRSFIACYFIRIFGVYISIWIEKPAAMAVATTDAAAAVLWPTLTRICSCLPHKLFASFDA